MLLSIAMNYGFGRWVHRWKFQCRYLTLPVTLTVICNLALLFVFKYLTFTLESLNSLGLELAIPGIRLPIGISFFTFQALSYVLDVAMGKARVQRSILDLGLYISFFPQLIAGPIVKYGDVAEQIRNRQENWEGFSAGCSRFLIGLSKKVLIANQVAGQNGLKCMYESSINPSYDRVEQNRQSDIKLLERLCKDAGVRG
jgi:alginate O-acetyltransferase complex protein AlgI